MVVGTTGKTGRSISVAAGVAESRTGKRRPLLYSPATLVFAMVYLMLSLAWPAPAPAAQESPTPPPPPATPPAPVPPPAPALRRWVDVQHLQLAHRYRWFESTEGRLGASGVQWQPQVRARVLLDAEAKYALHVGAFGGSSFISGWNNTGAGLGEFAGNFAVKQLFFAAQPSTALELQVGSLYLARGESTEITTYDNDAYVTGERATWRPSEALPLQLMLTTGHLGDTRTPNAFGRLDRVREWNYGQLLGALTLTPALAVSADYTYEGGRDTLRQGATVFLPARIKTARALKVEAYERLSPDRALGIGISVDLRPAPGLVITAGAATVDREYGGLNGDRFDRGTRIYSAGSYALTRDLAVGYFWGEGISNARPIANEHRVEVLVTVNPTARLRQKGVF